MSKELRDVVEVLTGEPPVVGLCKPEPAKFVLNAAIRCFASPDDALNWPPATSDRIVEHPVVRFEVRTLWAGDKAFDRHHVMDTTIVQVLEHIA